MPTGCTLVAERVTRGNGLLEGLLARRRAAVADRLLPEDRGEASLLDIGCGSHPLFLLRSGFRHRVGIDKLVGDGAAPAGVELIRHDFERDPRLPLPPESFDAVTMLAVFEHLEPAVLVPLLADTRRVLRPGGTLVLTTPAGWTDPLIRVLARLRLVSREEIEEHKGAYDHDDIGRRLVAAGYDPAALRFGTFELFMNLWVTARA